MYKLKVEGMTCGHCAARITQAVRSIDTAAKVEADLTSKQVLIESECELAELVDTLAAAGYPAEPVAAKR